ncbi:MAG: sugar phosphate isomerase/epimerase family protein [Opitutaceae bacterium]
MTSRRTFIKTGSLLAAGILARGSGRAENAAGKSMSISLAQWSLNRAFKAGELDPMDFARIARRDFEIEAVEYVNQFYFDSLSDAVTRELRKRAENEGVRSLLIMCDREGRIGDPDKAERAKTVANHHRWAEAARALGCHSIRVNAGSEGSFEEQQKLAADGLRRLSEYCRKLDLNVLVENHGGLSSNGAWLAGVMKLVDLPNCGTLPDFGNFTIDRKTGETYDRYTGVEELMPFAKAVSAKSYDFDATTGEETTIDYERMISIVRAAGYHGHVGIEYEGKRLSESEGIIATRRLLEKLL